MKKIISLMQAAKTSSFKLWLLNFLLARGIPFNAPHGFKISAIKDDAVSTTAVYKRRNFNHVRGIHACAIATISEFSAGATLMMRFNPAEYRCIMSHLEVDYFYQAKQAIVAKTHLPDADLVETSEQLKTQDKVIKVIKTEVHDKDDNHIATVITHWQLKSWAKVRTKV